MISVCMAVSKERADILDFTLAQWLDQKNCGEFEVLIVSDKTDIPAHPRLRVITPVGPYNFVMWYNQVLREAKGDYILITQPDLEVNSHNHIRNMQALITPANMVSERFWKNGKRSSGMFCQMLLLSAADLKQAGYFYEGFTDLISCEDTDLVSTLIENGTILDFYLPDEEWASHHVPHATNYEDPEVAESIRKANRLYTFRHKISLKQLYAKQFLCRDKKFRTPILGREEKES